MLRHHEAVGGFLDASQERADNTSFEGYEAKISRLFGGAIGARALMFWPQRYDSQSNDDSD